MQAAIELDCLLTDSQYLLLHAALLQGDAAVHAWQEWHARYRLESIGSDEYQILPQVFCNLDQLNRLDDAGPVLARLKGIAKRSWLTAHMAQQSLREALRLFQTASIPSIVHGGLDLFLLGYCSQRARQLNGVNMLIRMEDLTHAHWVLQKADWRPNKSLPPAELLPFFQTMAYTHPTHQELRLSWRPFGVDSQHELETALWQHAVPCPVGEVSAYVLDPTYLLLLTNLQLSHTAAHSLVRLLTDMKCIVDAASTSVDWELVYQRARQLRLLHPLQMLLAVLQQDFETAVPESFFRHDADFDFYDSKTPRCLPFLEDQGIRSTITALWVRYMDIKGSDGQGTSLIGFLRFAITYYQYIWGLRSHWLVPAYGLIKVYQYLRQQTVNKA